MARLKIGDGIQFEAQLPKIEQSEPNIEPSGTNLLAYIHETMNKEVESRKEIDLTYLENNINDLRDYIKDTEDKLATAIIELSNRKIDLPEVKQITHIQDVSPRVLKECDQRIKYTEDNIMLKVSDLQKKNRTQKIINFVLGCTVLLTIFLHLK